jgi:hypothetical protein
MNNTKHTPEPWVQIGPVIADEWYDHIAVINGTTDNVNEANAARIVACVNACEGMGDPEATIKQMQYELERFRTGFNDVETRQIAELKAQRDELRDSILLILEKLIDGNMLSHAGDELALSTINKIKKQL